MELPRIHTHVLMEKHNDVLLCWFWTYTFERQLCKFPATLKLKIEWKKNGVKNAHSRIVSGLGNIVYNNIQILLHFNHYCFPIQVTHLKENNTNHQTPYHLNMYLFFLVGLRYALVHFTILLLFLLLFSIYIQNKNFTLFIFLLCTIEQTLCIVPNENFMEKSKALSQFTHN